MNYKDFAEHSLDSGFFPEERNGLAFFVDFADNTVYRYCDSFREAKQIQTKLQSLAGSAIEKEGMFLIAQVCDANEAIKELTQNGFSWEEVI